MHDSPSFMSTSVEKIGGVLPEFDPLMRLLTGRGILRQFSYGQNTPPVDVSEIWLTTCDVQDLLKEAKAGNPVATVFL